MEGLEKLNQNEMDRDGRGSRALFSAGDPDHVSQQDSDNNKEHNSQRNI